MATQMRLISEEEYQKYIKFRNEQLNLNKDTKDNLKLLESDLPEEIKLNIYSKKLQSLNKKNMEEDKVNEKQENITPVPEKEEKSIQVESFNLNKKDQGTQIHSTLKMIENDSSFLTDFGDQAKEHGIMLLTLFRNNPSVISWNSLGNISFNLRSPDYRTDIGELLSYCLRRMRNVNTPPGLTRFYAALDYLKVSPYILTSPAKEQYIKFREDAARHVMLREMPPSGSTRGTTTPRSVTETARQLFPRSFADSVRTGSPSHTPHTAAQRDSLRNFEAMDQDDTLT